MADDNQALLLQVSADISRLEKAFKKANGIVDSESTKMEKRAKQMAEKIEAGGKTMFGGMKLGADGAETRLGKLDNVIRGRFSSTLQNASANAGALGSDLGALGPAGLVAAAGIGALALAFGEAQKTMVWADDLAQLADNLGITSEELQKLGYVAKRSNVDQQTLVAGLGALNSSLGAIKTGVGDAKLIKAFAAIGIKPDQLKSMRDASELLPLLATKLQGLDKASQIRIADKLGVKELLPILTEANGKISDLSDEAAKLGLVIDNQTVKSLADLNNQVEVASERIDVSLKKSFVDLAPSIAFVTTKLADFLQLLTQKMPGGDTVGGRIFKATGQALNPLGSAKDAVVDFVKNEKRRYGFLHQAWQKGMYGKAADDYAAQAERDYQYSGSGGGGHGGMRGHPVAATTGGIGGIGGGGRARSAARAVADDPNAELKRSLTNVIGDLETDDEKAAKVLEDRVRTLNDAMARGLITARAYNEELKRAKDDFMNPGGEKPQVGKNIDHSDGIEALKTQAELAGKAWHPLLDQARQIGDVFEDSFDRAGGSMQDFGAIFANELEQMAVEWAAAKVAGFLFGSRDDNGDRSGGLIDNFFGHNAMGTDNWRGGPTWVGERGPEIVNLPRGAQVIPNHKVQNFATPQRQSSPMHVTLNSHYTLSGVLGQDEVATWVHASHDRAVQTAVEQVRRQFKGMQDNVGAMGR